MDIRDRLSSVLGRKDQGPNRQLAEEIVSSGDDTMLRELVGLLGSDEGKKVWQNCALTLAWISEIKPGMLSPHLDLLIDLLAHPVNRVVFGSMIALSHMAPLVPGKLFDRLPEILDAMDAGTPVTRDHGFRILIILYGLRVHTEDLFFIIQEQLRVAPPNQLGQYTERFLKVMDSKHVEDLSKTLEERKNDLVSSYHLKRLEKNLRVIYTRKIRD